MQYTQQEQCTQRTCLLGWKSHCYSQQGGGRRLGGGGVSQVGMGARVTEWISTRFLRVGGLLHKTVLLNPPTLKNRVENRVGWTNCVTATWRL